jgi:outer membrane protein OmpA-like peptidoglycan-associated protein
MARPLLDGVELEQVQEIQSDDAEAVETHGVPVLEGDFLQDLGRRAVRITLNGAMLGTTAGDSLKTLREKFRGATPVSFVSDIATATKVDKVLIEDFGVREIAGRPARFEYALTLREFIPPPGPAILPPPIKPPPTTLAQQLTVEVIVTGQPAFDFNTVTVTIDGKQDDGTQINARQLTNRTNNRWVEDNIQPGDYTAKAVVTAPTAMSGTAHAVIGKGEKVKVTITLTPGPPIAKSFIIHFRFDRAFVEPCLREVAAQAVHYASTHPNEKLVIVGNTDLTGTPPPQHARDYNQSLSERRGRSVYALMTFGRDRAGALKEWNELRLIASGGLPSMHDSWSVREYQFMLQDLDYYNGAIDEQHGPKTDAGVRAFQSDHGLPSTGVVDAATWSKLIEAYLGAQPLNVPESQFLKNANDGGCDGGILKWLGCGEDHPVKNTQDAWRPNRRTELLFIATDKVPCQVAKPVTFELPPPDGAGPTWCLGAGDPNDRCCFMSTNDGADGNWQVTAAEPGSVTVTGSITSDDGTPYANKPYVLIAPDGEYMDGEHPRPPQSGLPIPGRTAADGTFAYPDKPKGVGIYILTVLPPPGDPPLVVRLASDPPGGEKGDSVCMHLDGSAPFKAIVSPAESGDPRRKLRGTLFDDFGTPLKQAPVTVTFEDGSSVAATTNDDGKFVADMAQTFATAKIQYTAPNGAVQAYDFFIDVQDVATDEGVHRRLENLGYPAEDDLAAAILAFQAAQGLDTTAEADQQTRDKLTAVHDGADPLIPPFPVDETALPAGALGGVGP